MVLNFKHNESDWEEYYNVQAIKKENNDLKLKRLHKLRAFIFNVSLVFELDMG